MKQYLLNEEQLKAINPHINLEAYGFCEHPYIAMKMDVMDILERKGCPEKATEVWNIVIGRLATELATTADLIINEETSEVKDCK